jgi:hypothetical protein
MSRGTVISLCDKTGNMVRPWAEAGFDCVCVDIQHPIRTPRIEGRIRYEWGDVRTWSPPESIARQIKVVFAFPPCTHVAVSGARDFRTNGTGLLRDSLELFSACEHAAKWSGAPYMIENPVGKFSDHMGPPNFFFHPWQYGDPWTKKTCLWTGAGFRMPTPTHSEPPAGTSAMIHLMSPSPDRANRRSITSPGFAQAVFAENSREATQFSLC